jgi:micrococcal nuclease
MPGAGGLKVYEYRATVKRILDGDTIEAVVDLGFTVHVTVKLRLAGIDCPEMKTPEGLRAKQHLSNLITGKTLCIKVLTKDSFGRWVALLWVEDIKSTAYVNDLMIEAGHAVPYRKK